MTTTGGNHDRNAVREENDPPTPLTEDM